MTMRPVAVMCLLLTTAAVADERGIPEIVKHGRRPGVRACGDCHLPNGLGRPESAGLAGLPAAYLEQQMADYRRGVRRNVDVDGGPAAAMIAVARAATDADVRAASAYFSSIAYLPWVRVIESGTATGIVERPAADSGFVAYVPEGSVKRGEALVTTGGGGRTVRCALCHGEDLKGAGGVPAIAGRSPSYQARQLRDMQRGARRGLTGDFMKGTVARLTADDITAIVAYTASRAP